ncbi:MAG: hypothetical protein IPM82_02775 [Saprospiraceae bacterium]|nr:hypothetical protein [Saprospiraceae bacterium]
MPFSYTNRCGAQHFFKKTATKKGGYRYYITKKADDTDLIDEVPEGFEVKEMPYDGKVIIRKIIPSQILSDEAAIVQQAMERQSPVKDFMVRVEGDAIEIHISQFSHYHDEWYPTAAEVEKSFGKNVALWKRYDWILSFVLADENLRIWSVIRKADVIYDAVEIERSTNLNILSEKYCYHVGRASLINFWIPGEDW